MTDKIKKTIEYITEQFGEGKEYQDKRMAYRYQHSLRVARVGQIIAREEGLDEESLVIACLLHDLAYVGGRIDDWTNHGRVGAEMAKDFVGSLQLNDRQTQDILNGISMHVDEELEREEGKTITARSVGDCDNIDRFDVYRLYDNLSDYKFKELLLAEQLQLVDRMLVKLDKYITLDFTTPTATRLWRDKVSYQREFLTRLKTQLSVVIE